jgi:hypothetical protein
VAGDLAVVVLGVLHEVIGVHPVVEQQHVLGGLQDGVSLLQLAAVDARADVLQIHR